QGPSGVAEELLTIPGVVVRAGERCADPRLQQIDLVGRARAIRVRVAGPDGERVEDAAVRAFLPAAPRTPIAAAELDDVATFLSLGAPLALEVWAPGYRREQRAGVREDVDVTLRRSLARPLHMHVELPTDADQVSSPLVAEIALEGVVPYPDAGWLRRWLDADGDATFELSEPGRWRVVLTLDSPRSFWNLGHYLGRQAIELPATYVDVDEGSAALDVMIELPARAL